MMDISLQGPGDVRASGSGVAMWDAPYHGAAHGPSGADTGFNAEAGNAAPFATSTGATGIQAARINGVAAVDASAIPAPYREGRRVADCPRCRFGETPLPDGCGQPRAGRHTRKPRDLAWPQPTRPLPRFGCTWPGAIRHLRVAECGGRVLDTCAVCPGTPCGRRSRVCPRGADAYGERVTPGSVRGAP